MEGSDTVTAAALGTLKSDTDGAWRQALRVWAEPTGGSAVTATVKGFLLYFHLEANQKAKKTPKNKQTQKTQQKQNFENSLSITYVVNSLYLVSLYNSPFPMIYKPYHSSICI